MYVKKHLSDALDGQAIVAEAVVSVDAKGKTHIHIPYQDIVSWVLLVVAY